MIRNQKCTATIPNRHPVILRALANCLTQSMETKDAKILSFGCSSGEECLAIAENLKEAQVFGCDIDLAMVEQATARCAGVADIFESNLAHLREKGPFHAITAFNVLCRHPLEGNQFLEAYPFSVFEDTFNLLDEILVPGGILAIYNPQYPVEACARAADYEALNVAEIQNNGWLDKYRVDGSLALSQGKVCFNEQWMIHGKWLLATRTGGRGDVVEMKSQFEAHGPASNLNTVDVLWRKASTRS